MKGRGLSAAGLSAVLIAAAATLTLAQDPELAAEAERPPVGIAVDCTSSPERVVITNNNAKPIKLKSVGSTYQRRAGEPYKVKKTLKPGKRATYTFGTGKGGGKRLSGSFIFDNAAPDEGVVVRTNRGRFKALCNQRTNAPTTSAPVASPTAAPPQQGQADIPMDADANALLATLSVRPEVAEGYDRARFEHWVDADGNGCDTREEVLIRDSSTPVEFSEGCRVESGTWYSAPDGDTLTNPASVDINHVVPLQEAWASGASEWTDERRRAFANDLDDERTLQAVSAGANRQQSDADPASWLPADREVACQFVRDWVAIKAGWGLSVDQTERDAISATLDACDAPAET